MQKPVKRLSVAEARQKIYHYCAYQERSHQEVKDKLYGYGLYGNEVDELLSHLITEGYLNEERFARAFAGGKFRILKWGKIKIQHELEAEGLTPRCIARGLSEISSADYSKTLHRLVRKKSLLLTEENLFKKKNKVARFVIGRGFEPELAWEAVNELLG